MSSFWIRRAACLTGQKAGIWGGEQVLASDGQGLPLWQEAGRRPFDRYGRLDPLSKVICWLAEQALGESPVPPDSGLLLATGLGSVEADLAYYRTAATDTPALASPKLFPYTLASAGLAEVAIRHQLHGPALVLHGDPGFTDAMSQAWHWLRAEDAEQCLILSIDVLLAEAAVFLSLACRVEGYAFVLSRKPGAWPLRRKGNHHPLHAADLWTALGNPGWQHPDWSLQ